MMNISPALVIKGFRPVMYACLTGGLLATVWRSILLRTVRIRTAKLNQANYRVAVMANLIVFIVYGLIFEGHMDIINPIVANNEMPTPLPENEQLNLLTGLTWLIFMSWTNATIANGTINLTSSGESNTLRKFILFAGLWMPAIATFYIEPALDRPSSHQPDHPDILDHPIPPESPEL